MEGTMICMYFSPWLYHGTITGSSSSFDECTDESEVDDSLLNVGLFTYPILQAGDIIAYRQVCGISADIHTIVERRQSKPCARRRESAAIP